MMMFSRKSQKMTARPRRLACWGTLFAGALLVVLPATASADEPLIMRVEEDWELHVVAPDPDVNAPQMICVFGPGDPSWDTHAIFEINHATAPDFTAGGMQLQCWSQDNMMWYGNGPNNREFDASVDVIKFTTRTNLSGGIMDLEVVNGQSANWGAFGGNGYLKVRLYTWRTNLNTYNPDYSAQNSQITYGKHRVGSFVRTEVRRYLAGGVLHDRDEDDTILFAHDGGDEVAQSN